MFFLISTKRERSRLRFKIGNRAGGLTPQQMWEINPPVLPPFPSPLPPLSSPLPSLSPPFSLHSIPYPSFPFPGGPFPLIAARESGPGGAQPAEVFWCILDWKYHICWPQLGRDIVSDSCEFMAVNAQFSSFFLTLPNFSVGDSSPTLILRRRHWNRVRCANSRRLLDFAWHVITHHLSSVINLNLLQCHCAIVSCTKKLITKFGDFSFSDSFSWVTTSDVVHTDG